MNGAKCPVCGNNISFITYLTSLTPYQMKCGYCKAKLKLARYALRFTLMSCLSGLFFTALLVISDFSFTALLITIISLPVIETVLFFLSKHIPLVEN